MPPTGGGESNAGVVDTNGDRRGWTENAGPENGGPKKINDMKMQDQIAGHENAGPENAGPQKQDRKMKYKLPKAIT